MESRRGEVEKGVDVGSRGCASLGNSSETAPRPSLPRLGCRSIALGLVGGSSAAVGAEVGPKVVRIRLHGSGPAHRGCGAVYGLGM